MLHSWQFGLVLGSKSDEKNSSMKMEFGLVNLHYATPE